jgi:hypothetical protein
MCESALSRLGSHSEVSYVSEVYFASGKRTKSNLLSPQLSPTILNFTHDGRGAFESQCLGGGGGISKATGRLSVLFFWLQS